MACEHIKLADGSTAVACGLRRTKSKPCHFCDNRGTKLCEWPVEKPVKILHHKLSDEDTIVTVQHKYPLKVQGLHRFNYCDGTMTVPVTMYGLTFPDGRSFVYYKYGKDQLSVLRPGTCDNPICDLHSRHVGEEKDYCVEHWGAWESVS